MLDHTIDHRQEDLNFGEEVRIGREGIGRKDDEIGELTGFKRPQLVLAVKHVRRLDGHHPQPCQAVSS